MKKLRKICLFALVTFEILALNVSPALAVHIPSASEMAADLENRYHISSTTLRDMGESLNTSNNKNQAPQVSLSFNPTDPKLGEKVSATATPMFFNNDPKSLYFTWYLQHPGCEESSSVTPYNQKCDLNSDSKVNEKDWKIEAARIIASNDFDWNRALGPDSANCSVYSANQPEYCSLFDKYMSDSDDDGYRASLGGDDQKNKTGDDVPVQGGDSRDVSSHCYIHDFRTGINYELVKKVADQGAACEDFGDGITRTPVCARTQEDVTPSDTAETTLTFTSSSLCKKTNDAPICSIEDETTANFSCPSPDEVPMCVDLDNNMLSDNTLFECIDHDANPVACPDFSKTADGGSCTVNADCQSNNCAAGTCSQPACAINSDCPSNFCDAGTCEAVSSATDSCENIDADDTLWPKGSGYPFDQISCGSDSSTLNQDVEFTCDDSDKRHLFAYPAFGSPSDSGDNSFSGQEELFWHTNPESASTAGNGNKDEANVVGLGQTTFSWNYEPGDKVGVAVEGVSSIPTKYEDSSQMIMWALPKNKCEIEKVGTYTKNIKGYDVRIPITSITDDEDGQDSCLDDNCLNDCLKDNLVDPRGDQNSLNVSLSYSPDNPVNDPSSDNAGDELVITSSIPNAKNPSFLKYQWEIYAGNSVNPAAGWGDPLLKSQIPGSPQTSGIGLSSFKFKLNFSEPVPQYLKIRAVVSEKIDSFTNNSGSSSIIVPVTNTANKIHIYSSSANENLALTLETDRERCASGLDGAVCPVVKNEIIGMQVDSLGDTLSNLLWTLDGQPLAPISKDCASGDCVASSGEATDTAYFPILKENGEQYTVGMTADTSSGKKITLTKTFQVVDPNISVVSADTATCQPVLLGNYVDLDNKLWPDYSNTDFTAVTGQTIYLKPEINMPFLKNAQWFIDGAEATSLGANVDASDNTLSFTANKQPGETYSIVLGGVYTQDNNIKKILNSTYNVPLDGFYEKPVGVAIKVSMTDSLGDSTATAAVGHKILASIITNTPAYISFLIRIVMTALLILFTSWLILSLSPKINER